MNPEEPAHIAAAPIGVVEKPAWGWPHTLTIVLLLAHLTLLLPTAKLLFEEEDLTARHRKSRLVSDQWNHLLVLWDAAWEIRPESPDDLNRARTFEELPSVLWFWPTDEQGVPYPLEWHLKKEGHYSVNFGEGHDRPLSIDDYGPRWGRANNPALNRTALILLEPFRQYERGRGHKKATLAEHFTEGRLAALPGRVAALQKEYGPIYYLGNRTEDGIQVEFRFRGRRYRHSLDPFDLEPRLYSGPSATQDPRFWYELTPESVPTCALPEILEIGREPEW